MNLKSFKPQISTTVESISRPAQPHVGVQFSTDIRVVAGIDQSDQWLDLQRLQPGAHVEGRTIPAPVPLQTNLASVTNPSKPGDCAEAGLSQLNQTIALKRQLPVIGNEADPCRLLKAVVQGELRGRRGVINTAGDPVRPVGIPVQVSLQTANLQPEHRLQASQAGQGIEGDIQTLKADSGTVVLRWRNASGSNGDPPGTQAPVNTDGDAMPQRT